MRIIRGLHNLKPLPHGCVATIGNFDGVHRGHRIVIENLSRIGKGSGLPVFVILFEPQPQEFLVPKKAPARLTRLREKILHLEKLPVDFIVLLRFDRHLANQEPESFIQKTLVKGLRIKHLVIGDDFRFGKNRTGDFSLLSSFGEKEGFTVEKTPSFQLGNQRVSSTLIRHALQSGDFGFAQQLLGRAYSVCGKVVVGKKRGRSIGFPTANIRMNGINPPVKGVFAVTMSRINEFPIQGVANIGTRPTVNGEAVLLEVHLFEFSADIYGRCVEVHFVKKIRDEKRFDTFDELKEQIKQDVAVAQELFANMNTPTEPSEHATDGLQTNA